MQKHLKIVAVALLVAGIGAFLLAATQYSDSALATEVVAAQQEGFNEAIHAAKVAVGTDKEAITKDYARKQSRFVEMALQQQAQVNQQMTLSVVVGGILVIGGGVMWFISRKRAEAQI